MLPAARELHYPRRDVELKWGRDFCPGPSTLSGNKRHLQEERMRVLKKGVVRCGSCFACLRDLWGMSRHGSDIILERLHLVYL